MSLDPQGFNLEKSQVDGVELHGVAHLLKIKTT